MRFHFICMLHTVSMHKMQPLTVLPIDVNILCEYFLYILMLLVMRNFGNRVFFLISSDQFQPIGKWKFE